jgi:hypothetical protein
LVLQTKKGQGRGAILWKSLWYWTELITNPNETYCKLWRREMTCKKVYFKKKISTSKRGRMQSLRQLLRDHSSDQVSRSLTERAQPPYSVTYHYKINNIKFSQTTWNSKSYIVGHITSVEADNKWNSLLSLLP